MQDRHSPQTRKSLLATHGRTIHLGHPRRIGRLPPLAACPVRSESGYAHACLDMSAKCQLRPNALHQKAPLITSSAVADAGLWGASFDAPGDCPNLRPAMPARIAWGQPSRHALSRPLLSALEPPRTSSDKTPICSGRDYRGRQRFRYVATKSAGPARVAIDKKIAQDRPRALRLIGSGKAPVVTVSARRDSPATQSFPATKINTRVNRAGDATGLF